MAISIRKLSKGKKSPFVIGGAQDKWLDIDFIKDIDMNSYAKKAVISTLRKRCRLLSPHKMQKLNYFFTYKLDDTKQKVPSCLYVNRRRDSKVFVKITASEMMISGASPVEYETFMLLVNAYKIRNTKEIFDEINL